MTTAPAPRVHCRYQDPDATLTLAEGLEEFRSSQPGILSEEGMDEESARLFRAHDYVHVLFGLSTAYENEALADTWGLLGTTVRLRDFYEYTKLPAAKEVLIAGLREYGYWGVVKSLFRSIPLMWRVWKNSRKMTKKWDWDGYDAYRDRPLSEIRREFGIELVQAS